MRQHAIALVHPNATIEDRTTTADQDIARQQSLDARRTKTATVLIQKGDDAFRHRRYLSAERYYLGAIPKGVSFANNIGARTSERQMKGPAATAFYRLGFVYARQKHYLKAAGYFENA